MLGELLGNYRIVRKLGEGGMGEVYLAQHEGIGTHVAVKLLFPHISTETAHVDRFFNEARAVAKIRHAGIVKISDVGFTPTGRAYLLMEFLEGESLSDRIARGPQPLPAACELARQIASVLAATHASGVIHRDLKPDNIFLVPDHEQPGGERAKVLDFGIAKLTGAIAHGLPTQSHSAMGTPMYMSPEQWGDASKVDSRADIYSLGCIVFELLTGRPPFQSSSMMEACAMHTQTPPPRLRSLVPELPQSVEELLDRMLAKSPADRPQTMQELVRAFAELRGSSGIYDVKYGTGGMAALPMTGAMAPIPATGAMPAAPSGDQAPVAAAGQPTAVGRVRGAAADGAPAATAIAPARTEIAPGRTAIAPTTTTSPPAAGEVAARSAPPRSRRLWLALGGGAVVAGAAVIAIVALGGGHRAAARAIDAAVVMPPVDAAPLVDAAPMVDAAVPAGPPLRERVEAADPFVTVGAFTVQRGLVSRELYGWYVASLPAGDSGHQPLDHVALAGSAAVTSVTFAQARDFCRAIDADLPTSDQWSAFASAKKGPATVGPESEWTGPDADGVALVRDPRDRGKEPDDPLYLSTALEPGAGPESVARATIGFRCAR